MTEETLRYHVLADYGQLTAMQAQMNGLSGTMAKNQALAAKHEAAFHQVGRSAGLVALGLAGITAMAFKSSAEFDSAMNTFQVTSGATAAQMDEAGKKAIELGNSMQLPGVNARDAADAMNELAKGGFNAQQSMEAVTSVLQLGKAADYDLATSATVVARSLKAFNMPAKQSQIVVDALAAASLKSTVGIQEIADGMTYAATPAHQLGISFKDTATALAILNDRGIVGSQAGSAFGIAMVRLAHPTKAATAALKDLNLINAQGIPKFFDAQGSFVGMKKATELWSGATKGQTQQQKLATAQIVFGIRGMRAAQLVLGGGVKTWDDYRAAVGKQGMAQKLLDARMKGSKGAIEGAKNAVSTFALVFGAAVAPAITAVLKPLTQFVTFLGKFPGVVSVAVGVIGGLATALFLVSKAMKALQTAKEVGAFLGILTTAESAATGTTYALNTALLLNPFVLIAVAVIALVVAIVLLWRRSETFRAIVTAAFDAVKAAGMAMWQGLVAAFNAIMSAISAVIDWVRSNWKLLIAIFLGPIGIIADIIITHFNDIKNFITTVVNAIVNIVRTVLSTLVSIVKGIADAVVNAFTTALRAGINLARTVINAIKSAILAIWNAAPSWLRGPATAMINAMVAAVRRGIGLARSAVVAIKNAIVSFFSSAGHWLLSAGADVVMGLVHGIEGRLGAVVGAAGKLKDAFMGALGSAKNFIFGSPSRLMMQAGGWVVDGFASGIDQNGYKAAAAAGRLAQTTINAVKSKTGIFIEFGSDASTKLADGIKKGTPKAEIAAATLAAKAIAAARRTMATAATSLGGLLTQAFQAGQSAQQTPAEALLAQMQKTRDEQQRQQALADAQAQVAAATNATEQLAAQKQLADAQYAIQVAALEAQAAEERKNLDFAQQQKKAAFDADLAKLQTYLDSAKVTAGGAQKKIAAFMAKYGVDYQNVGDLLGTGFAQGLHQSIPKAVSAARALATAVQRALKEGFGIKSPSTWMRDEIGKNLAVGLAVGLDKHTQTAVAAASDLVQRVQAGAVTTATAPAVPTAPAVGAVGGQAGGFVLNVHGDMHVTDERDAELVASAVFRTLAFG